jgi:hypothetical protein
VIKPPDPFERKESVIPVRAAAAPEEPVAAPRLIYRIYSFVTKLLSSIAEYMVPYTQPVDENRAYAAAVLANANGPRFEDARYVFAVRQEDEDSYNDILPRSAEDPRLRGTFIEDQPVFEFRTPNICDTSESIVPEIPHAPLINWFLTKKNIRQLLSMGKEDHRIALEAFLKHQFLSDFKRRRFDGDKTYVIDGVTKDAQGLLHALDESESEEVYTEAILTGLFGRKFVETRYSDLLPLMALMCQNSGITAHAMIEAHERRLNPQLEVVCLNLMKQQDHFRITTERDQSITFCYTFNAPYRFMFSDGTQQLKSAKLVFSMNLRAPEDGLSSPPIIHYSYLVNDLSSTSS